jgi:hypothetical protein
MRRAFIRLIPLLPFLVLAVAVVVAAYHVRYRW